MINQKKYCERMILLRDLNHLLNNPQEIKKNNGEGLLSLTYNDWKINIHKNTHLITINIKNKSNKYNTLKLNIGNYHLTSKTAMLILNNFDFFEVDKTNKE